MGHHELLAALHREGEEKAAAIRAAAEAEAVRLRTAAAARLSALRQEEERHRERLRAEQRQNALAEAARGARIIRLTAEHNLALHLRELATAGLNGLRAAGYEQLFHTLANELPREAWGTVLVNPLDVPLAGCLFPAAVIESNAGITGGLIAMTADRSFTVANTLEVRLQRLWPALLPDVVAELRRDGA